jgi:methylenetetrahydrofolate reductase (NADPH)
MPYCERRRLLDRIGSAPEVAKMSNQSFRIICEISSSARPDLMGVRHQIAILSGVADAFLIADNHLGHATISSVAVAHEVQTMGGVSIACLNSRDRNLLGFRRDLLTAAAYGVDHLLFVYGDKPDAGSRTGQLTVRGMMDEVRELSSDPVFAGRPRFQVGTVAGPGKLPSWKRGADFILVQVSFSLDDLLRWRAANPVEVPVYAGVMVIASTGHARRLAASVSDIAVPADLMDKIATDRLAGVEAACEQVLRIRDSGEFDGVHLIPVARYREVASRLERML